MSKNQWTIGKRLFVSFMCLAAITLALGVAGYWGAVQGDTAVTEIGVVRLPGVQSLLIISEAQTAVDSAENALLSTQLDDTARAAQYQRFTDAKKRADDAWAVYEPLPQTAEEAATWSQFVPAWDAWWKDHETFVTDSRQFDAEGIKDPTMLEGDLRQFIGDHWKLCMHLTDHVTQGDALEGGDDPTKCNFGRWLATFQTANSDLQKIFTDIKPFHDAFHACVKKAKELAVANDKEGAVAVIHGDMEAAQGKVFSGFDAALAKAEEGNKSLSDMTHQALTINGVSFAAAETLLNKLVEINTKVAADSTQMAASNGVFLKAMNLGATIAGVVSALLLGLLITRSINGKLSRIASSLGEGAEQTASAADQVSQSGQGLAEGASEQASSLEETSASLEQMASMTRQNADNASQCQTLMHEAKGVVEDMSKATEEMSAAIKDIKHSSDETSKIIKTIDEIAFQTNLLALNAAVEAARAGDAGKGFAVVAEEVRNLARRSAEAAKHTAELIEESCVKADNGVKVTERVAHALNKTVENSMKVAQLVDEVSAASKEQAQGIDQVNTAVSQMDQVTQNNAANAEESASAAEELSAQAVEMKRLVNELLALVGGASSQGPRRETRGGVTAKAAGHPASVKSNGQKAVAVSPAKKATAFKASSASKPPVRKQRENEEAALAGAVAGAKRSPEDIIPLEDGDFGDF